MTANARRLAYFERWVDPVAEEMLRARPEIDLIRLAYADSGGDNAATMARAHGYQIAPRTELREPWFADASLLRRCPQLLAISSTGAGFDMVDVAACTAAGVIVCNQSGSNKEAVAEHALGLMLALAKNIGATDRALRRTAGLERFAYTGRELAGRTVGIVGIGQIGTRTAALCRGLFGMTVLAHDPYLSDAEVATRGAAKVPLDELLARADFVSVHCPRNEETFGMFGAAEFARMKPTAYFVNTARGGIHDESALAAALAGRRIAGAGLDVFLVEPPAPDHPLLAFENVIATPHIAGITEEALRNMAAAAAEQWITLFAGRVPPRLVNPAAWPLYSQRFEALLGIRPDPLPGGP
ncbi:MAG: hydroxyacid dehydrogenase [Alphaproteobacteria bacterium]|nr:hydroxyacid dehydrogenase [Alphaproteobacteria bacterium]